MADYSFPTLTSAIAGIASTISFKVQSTSPYVVEVSNGTVSIGNYTIGLSASAIPAVLSGRRPSSGQVFPRGVYNK